MKLQQYNSNSENSVSETELLDLADNMASAATTFNAHGYEIFLQARERLKEAICVVFNQSEHQ